MFLKICRGPNESLFECDAYHIRSHSTASKNADNPKQWEESHKGFFIEIEGRRDLQIEIDKTVPEALGVWVMNSQGKTIDTIFTKDQDMVS